MFEHNQMPGSLELAYLGDTIYDLYVRRELVMKGGRVHKMHKAATSMVCAHGQSEALKRIEDILTDQEKDVVRRARNANQHPPRNADPGEYHRATGLEALIGYLYLTDKRDRMEELVLAALRQDTEVKA